MQNRDFNQDIDPKTYSIQQKFKLHKNQVVILARNRTDHSETIALRLRIGSIGYSEWLNEINAYLLPNFKHDNIQPFLNSYKRFIEPNHEVFNSYNLLEDLADFDNEEDAPKKKKDKYVIQPKNEEERKKKFTKPPSLLRSEFWISNSFSDCVTLRHFLMMHTLTWPMMLNIVRGIVSGLHFLHEYQEYQDLDQKRLVDAYIKSTNGALQKLSFRDKVSVIHMKPPLHVSIIHRNLSSMNIVLGPDYTPRIWNFGQSIVYHPFELVNRDHLVDWPIKKIFVNSPYSPPEVLAASGRLTLIAMKSIDMYACGILCWELMSRTALPKLEEATEAEDRERNNPDSWREPFAREFGQTPCEPLLKNAVCRYRTRPTIKNSWKAGCNTNSFIELYQDLWDQDFEARIHPVTLLNRLVKISTSEYDYRNIYPYRMDRIYDHKSMWPPKQEEKENLAAASAQKFSTNMVIEELSGLYRFPPN